MLILSAKNNKISKCFFDHHENVGDCYENFSKFFDVLFSDEPDAHQLESIKTAIDNCEAAADLNLRHAVDLIHESFLPITRANLIAIAQSTDEVANLCQGIARQILLESIIIPKELRKDIQEIIRLTEGQLTLLYTAIDKLLNDFKGISNNRKLLDDIRTLESHVDNVEAMLHKRIFQLNLPLYEKVYYRDLIEDICDIADTIEDIADQIQIMIVQREV